MLHRYEVRYQRCEVIVEFDRPFLTSRDFDLIRSWLMFAYCEDDPNTWERAELYRDGVHIYTFAVVNLFGIVRFRLARPRCIYTDIRTRRV